MSDPRFYSAKGPFRVDELAELADAALAAGADGTRRIADVAPLDAAKSDTISFLDNKRYLKAFMKTQAGACVVHPDMADRAPPGIALLLSKQPYHAYARIARAFYPLALVEPGIAPSAVVDPSAKLGPDCRVDAGAFVGPRCEIGARSHVSANVVIDAGVVVGDDCRIGACASLSHCLIGNRVVIYPGARIGQEGFGFATGPDGHLRIPQVGRVIVHDDVEIGANATVDRGAGTDTIIGAGCMIDNLVQIGHNVQLGRGCVIVAQAGISGSTKFDDSVVVAGQAGFAGHLYVGKGARIGAQCGVMRDVEAGAAVIGSPAMPVKQFFRQVATLRRLAEKKDDE